VFYQKKMMSLFYKFYHGLGLGIIGGAEMLIALYPILSSYQYGPIPFSLLIILLVCFIYYRRKQIITPLKSKIYKVLAAYVILHDIILIIVMGGEVPSVFINSLIALVISIMAVILITPKINWSKLEGCINWVTLICIIGMLYQYIRVQNGEVVGMLKIPFLPASGLERYNELYPRPHSFFEEPAMYAQFMLIPLFLALLRKNFIWAGIIAVSVLMSSSTTGLVLIFVEFVLFVFVGKSSIRAKAILLVLGGVLVWTLFNTDVFSMATDKFNNESDESVENIRLVQGPAIVSTMQQSDFVFGAPYANTYQYCIERRISTALFEVYGSGDDSVVYMTTIWQLFLRFGIVGVVLYLLSYIKLCKNRLLLPLLICFLVMTITASFWFGPSFVYYSIFLFGFHMNYSLYENTKTRKLV
jgi:hypothetical protein